MNLRVASLIALIHNAHLSLVVLVFEDAWCVGFIFSPIPCWITLLPSNFVPKSLSHPPHFPLHTATWPPRAPPPTLMSSRALSTQPPTLALHCKCTFDHIDVLTCVERGQHCPYLRLVIVSGSHGTIHHARGGDVVTRDGLLHGRYPHVWGCYNGGSRRSHAMRCKFFVVPPSFSVWIL